MSEPFRPISLGSCWKRSRQIATNNTAGQTIYKPRTALTGLVYDYTPEEAWKHFTKWIGKEKEYICYLRVEYRLTTVNRGSCQFQTRAFYRPGAGSLHECVGPRFSGDSPALDRHQQSPTEGHTPLLGRKAEGLSCRLHHFSRSGFILEALGPEKFSQFVFFLGQDWWRKERKEPWTMNIFITEERKEADHKASLF